MSEQADTAERVDGALDEMIERLVARYGGRYTRDEVAAAANRAYRRYADAKVRSFVAILVERDVREALETRN